MQLAPPRERSHSDKSAQSLVTVCFSFAGNRFFKSESLLGKCHDRIGWRDKDGNTCLAARHACAALPTGAGVHTSSSSVATTTATAAAHGVPNAADTRRLAKHRRPKGRRTSHSTRTCEGRRRLRRAAPVAAAQVLSSDRPGDRRFKGPRARPTWQACSGPSLLRGLRRVRCVESRC